MLDAATLAGATADELMDAIGQMHALSLAAQHKVLELLAEVDRREAWRDDGSGSAAAWLMGWLGISRRTATEWADAARKLEELPAIAAVFSQGGLAWDQLRLLCRFATPETDAGLAETAPSCTVAQLERMARQARPVSAREAAEAHRTRRFRMRKDRHGCGWRLSGRLEDADGAALAKAVERLAEQAPKNPQTGMWDSWEARCADALVALAHQRLADDADPDRATVVVHVDAAIYEAGSQDTSSDWSSAGSPDGSPAGPPDGSPAGPPDGSPDGSPAAGGLADIEGVGAIAVETARRLGCDCRLQVVVDGPDGEALALTSLARTAPPWMRRLLRRRDQYCRFPGCDRRSWLHAHHVVRHSRDGPTSTDNLALFCSFHHHCLHEGGWVARGDADRRLVFTSPRGTVLTSEPPRLRTEVAARFFDLEPAATG
ncbi:MAG: hypothetical protein JJLCMIEE_02733 [Acidimicrobiales bacterium]|nr:hypothetical protein [Acidimicrobiales bacterium]